MKTKTAILIMASLILLAFHPNLARDDIKTYLDFARFRYDAERVYLEIYYMVMPNRVSHQQTLRLNFKIFDGESGELLAFNNVQVPVHPTNSSLDAATAKLGLIKTVLPPGTYRLYMSCFDQNAQLLDSVSYVFSASPFKGERLMLSDLEICSNIIINSPRTESDYYKNNMEVIPNPSRIFSPLNNPVLYYYIELYNVDGHANQSSEITIQVVIADTDGQIRQKKSYRRPTRYESLVERGLFDIRKLESGLYALIFAVTDSAGNYSVYRRETFMVLNPNVVEVEEDEEQLFARSEFFVMPEAMLDQMFREAQYIATPEEINIYKTLTHLDGKRRFLFLFWRKRSKNNPNFKDEYYERVRYANERFKYGKQQGWESDRGRVYIIYGPPDQIERFPSTANENPYEIWYYYDIEGGVEFDFVDFSGFGDYKLVNSTKRGEISDPRWRSYIRKDYIR